MLFTISRVSISKGKRPCEDATKDAGGDWIVDIESLDDLLELCKSTKNELIITGQYDAMPHITIFDDHLY